MASCIQSTMRKNKTFTGKLQIRFHLQILQTESVLVVTFTNGIKSKRTKVKIINCHLEISKPKCHAFTIWCNALSDYDGPGAIVQRQKGPMPVPGGAGLVMVTAAWMILRMEGVMSAECARCPLVLNYNIRKTWYKYSKPLFR